MLYNVNEVVGNLNTIRPWLNNKFTRLEIYKHNIKEFNVLLDDSIVLIAKNDKESLLDAINLLIHLIGDFTIIMTLSRQYMLLYDIDNDITEDTYISLFNTLFRWIKNTISMIAAGVN